MTGLKGAASADHYSEMSLDNPRPYPEIELLEVTDAAASELRHSPEGCRAIDVSVDPRSGLGVPIPPVRQS
jgi:hypothetical protein